MGFVEGGVRGIIAIRGGRKEDSEESRISGSSKNYREYRVNLQGNVLIDIQYR